MATELFDELVSGLEEGISHVKGDLKLRATTVVMPPPPPAYSAQRIQDLRARLKLSQSGFSRLMNVSAKTIQSWEQGTRLPSHASLRLLQVIEAPETLKSFTDTTR